MEQLPRIRLLAAFLEYAGFDPGLACLVDAAADDPTTRIDLRIGVIVIDGELYVRGRKYT